MEHSFFNASLFLAPSKVELPLSWAGHIPFAFSLVEMLRPSLLVELGTHSGNSYFAFCQSVASNAFQTRCYAVDTWKGDEHAGDYGEEIYEDVYAWNDMHYSGFSSLLRMTFDEAHAYFADGSIDLLHIDGMHTYDAVRHDFELWLPKVSARGVVLFHDIVVRERNFGVWRLWEELSARYPSISFEHCNGLGVLFTGSSIDLPLAALLEAWQKPEFMRLCKMAVERLALTVDHSVSIREKDAELAKAAESLNRLGEEFRHVLQSKSWRLTEPFRRMSKTLHDIRQRFQEMGDREHAGR